MKTAISIDEELLREADETARTMGFSRSRLFAVAVTDFLQRARSEQMLRQLKEVYGGGGEPEEKRLVRGMKTKVRSTLTEPW